MADIAPHNLLEYDYQRPFLYPKQERAFFSPARIAYVEASTKAGKTHACIIWLTEKAALEGFAGWNGWWVAPTRAQAMIAMRRIKAALPKEFYRSSDSDGWIELINGARIWFKSSEKPDNLYGEDVYAAVYDEASRGRYDSWKALRSTVTATRGQIRLIANVKGKSNWFYMACRAAERDMMRTPADRLRPNVEFHRITCWDAVEAGVLDRDEVEEARKDLTDADFKELYEAIAQDDEEGFIPSLYVEKAIERGRAQSVQPYGARVIGGDPSQGKKDPAAFCIRKGQVVERIEEHKNMDEFGFIAHALRLIEVEKPAAFFMDGTGFGSTISKTIIDKTKGISGLTVKAFHMAERALKVDEYANKRAECWGEGRKALISADHPYSMPDDEGFSIELTCIRKVHRPHGKLQLEDKEELELRGYESPNMADAWALTYAEPVAFYTSPETSYPRARRNRNMA